MARPAYSLNTLLNQLDRLAPHRNKAADGWIGDAAHAARASDHNPDANGIVHARDYTHDPAGGLDCNWLAATLVLFSDRRVKYIIWNRKIWDPYLGWQPYNGANPHTKHLHLSVRNDNGDDSSLWQLETEDDMSGEGANIQATVLTGGPSTRNITYDEAAQKVVYPPGVDPTSVLGRVADVQWALTHRLARIESLLESILEALTDK